MNVNEDCARKVLFYIEDRVANGHKYGELNFHTLCGQNIFEVLLYGHQSVSEAKVLEMMKGRVPAPSMVVVSENKIYYGPQWRTG